MKLKISDIKISARIRQSNIYTARLRESIRNVGLINPIIVNENHELISGFRRLTACRELGWTEIDVTVIRTGDDELKKLNIEYHENIGRKDLNILDEENYNQMRYDILHPPKKKGIIKLFKRFWEFIRKLFESKKNKTLK